MFLKVSAQACKSHLKWFYNLLTALCKDVWKYRLSKVVLATRQVAKDTKIHSVDTRKIFLTLTFLEENAFSGERKKHSLFSSSKRGSGLINRSMVAHYIDMLGMSTTRAQQQLRIGSPIKETFVRTRAACVMRSFPQINGEMFFLHTSFVLIESTGCRLGYLTRKKVPKGRGIRAYAMRVLRDQRTLFCGRVWCIAQFVAGVASRGGDKMRESDTKYFWETWVIIFVLPILAPPEKNSKKPSFFQYIFFPLVCASRIFFF